jgi:hypothetical protein
MTIISLSNNRLRNGLFTQNCCYRWLEVALRGKKVLETARQVTIIADRESDIYEEW